MSTQTPALVNFVFIHGAAFENRVSSTRRRRSRCYLSGGGGVVVGGEGSSEDEVKATRAALIEHTARDDERTGGPLNSNYT